MIYIINILLFPLFLLYQLIVSIRNYLYDINFFKSTKLPCKVISVGNITVGGTGKTPTVIAIAKFLQTQNKKVAVLSRGYGRKSKGTQLVTNGDTLISDWKKFGDEPILMAKHLSNIPIVVDENRIRGGQYLINNFEPEIIILDDGFQHRKLFRNVDIVLINSNISKFKNRIFSFGNFREPWKSLKRAHLIFLSKSARRDNTIYLQDKLRSYAKPIVNVHKIPGDYLLDNNHKLMLITDFSGKTALLISGIGDPESFYKTVYGLNLIIIGHLKFRDHQSYSKSDIEKIRDKFQKSGADILLTTEKDFLKVKHADLPIYALPIAMDIEENGYHQLLKLIN